MSKEFFYRTKMKDDFIKRILLLLVLVLCCCFCKGAEHKKCKRTYEKIGCFKRPHSGVKLFDILVMTDRDKKAKQYGGQDMDWTNWPDYIHGFACRCLETIQQLSKEKDKKYHHFSISHYGECWTSEDIIYDLHKLGLDETCVGGDYGTCRLEAESECVGANYSQFVYHVHYEDEPLVDEFAFINSECTVETLTVCTSPSTSYVTSTVQP